MIRSEGSSSGHGPRLYTVKEAAAYLDCCQRQLRQEIREQKITYRLAPGGIRFTEQDLLERLRPRGGPSASSRSSKARKPSDSQSRDEVTKLTDPLNIEIELALLVIEEILRDKSIQSTKVANVLKSCWNGELRANLADLDGKVAVAVVVMIAMRARLAGDADSLLRRLLNLPEEPTL